MWNKIKNLFSSSKTEDAGVPLELSERSHVVPPPCPNQAECSPNECQINESYGNLSGAIRHVLLAHGRGMISEDKVLNVLTDYGVFKESPALKSILKAMIASGEWRHIMSLTSETATLTLYQAIVYKLESNYGFQKELVNDFVNSCFVGLGLITNPYSNHVKESSNNSELSQAGTSNEDFQNGKSGTQPIPPIISKYACPSIDILHDYGISFDDVTPDELCARVKFLTDVLDGLKLTHSWMNVISGFNLSSFEFESDVKSILKLRKNLNTILSLLPEGSDVILPQANTVIKVLIPNTNLRELPLKILLKNLIPHEVKLPMLLGNTEIITPEALDLSSLGNILVAGCDEYRKGMLFRTIIATLMFTQNPEDVVVLDIDKENADILSMDSENFAYSNWAKNLVKELFYRRSVFNRLDCNSFEDIINYNHRVAKGELLEKDGYRKLPILVLFIEDIDEVITQNGQKETERLMQEFISWAPSVGVFSVWNARTLSANVLTPNLRKIFENRICFKVRSIHESKLILGDTSAQRLMPEVDAYLWSDNQLQRFIPPYVDDADFNSLKNHFGEQLYELCDFRSIEDYEYTQKPHMDNKDPLFDEVARRVVSSNTASTSSIQRIYSLGYNRAGRIMDQLEQASIVGPSQGGKPRAVLVDPIELENILATL